MIVAAGVDVLEALRFVITALRVCAFEEKAFNLVGRIQGIALLVVEVVGIVLEHAANVGREGLAVLGDDVAEDQGLAGPQNVGWYPVENSPVVAQTHVALSLCGKASDRTTIEGS